MSDRSNHRNGLTVRDVMTPAPVTVPPGETIRGVVRRMNEHRIGAVLIGIDDALVGIFTERDQLIQYEMNVAGRLLNRALVPGAPHDGPDIAWAVRYSPLDAVGGDYYDFVAPDDRHIGVLIADASGHSVAAAMVAIMARIA